MNRRIKLLVNIVLMFSFVLVAAQCAPATPPPPQIVKETVVVEKQVEKIVEKPVEKIVEKAAPPVVQTVQVEKTVVVAPPKAGGDLVVRTSEDIENFDTATDQLQVFRSLIQWTIFEPLVQYDAQLKLNGVLAESWEQPSPTVWRFHLRKGVTFHNGAPFTAADAKYSLDRVKDPATASWLATNVASMTKAEAVDDNTLDVTLSAPVASFLDKLVQLGMVPKGSGDQQRRTPVGTGPFMFKEYKANEHVLVVKNPNYWQKGLPYLDSIKFRPIPETSVALTNLQAGDIQAVAFLNPAEAAAAMQVPGATITVQPATTSEAFFEVNRRKAPLNDPKVYAAIAKCIDRDAVGKLVYQGYGTATNVPVSPQSPFHKSIPYAYDPAKAKAELAALGYKDHDIKLEIISWGGYKDLENMAVVWKDGLAQAGVDVTVKVLEVQVMLDRYNKHDFDMATNVAAFPPDPDVQYDIMWGPRLADDYKAHAEAIDLISKARQITDVAQRKAFYDQLQDLGASDGPMVDVWFQAAMAANLQKVRNLVITPTTEYFFHNTYIEK
jgi:ABC-type transport system substrate-binding protein